MAERTRKIGVQGETADRRRVVIRFAEKVARDIIENHEEIVALLTRKRRKKMDYRTIGADTEVCNVLGSLGVSTAEVRTSIAQKVCKVSIPPKEAQSITSAILAQRHANANPTTTIPWNDAINAALLRKMETYVHTRGSNTGNTNWSAVTTAMNHTFEIVFSPAAWSRRGNYLREKTGTKVAPVATS